MRLLVTVCVVLFPSYIGGSMIKEASWRRCLEEYHIDPANILFYLYTSTSIALPKKISDSDDINDLTEAGYEVSSKTIFIIHGYNNNVSSDIIQDIKNNLFSMDEAKYNVIGVDWSHYANFYDTEVLDKSKAVGTLIGSFFEYLHSVGTDLQDIHCIGHSLGAHACGFAGHSLADGKIGRISGLDPAFPGFSINNTDERLDAEDAEFVDCIHTDGGMLGMFEPICSADFYPNGGRSQPGCNFTLGICEHARSREYFAESILSSEQFPTVSCPTEDNFDECDRTEYSGALMGYPADPQFRGVFYTKTNSIYPFAKDWLNDSDAEVDSEESDEEEKSDEEENSDEEEKSDEEENSDEEEYSDEEEKSDEEENSDEEQ